MTRDISVFVKTDTIFRLLFFGNYHKFELLTFARYCGSILKVWLEVLKWFVGNLLLFSAVKEY